MSLFSQLYKSLYSPKDMARFRFQKIGKTILYILLLALLTSIPETMQAGQFIKEQVLTLQHNFQTDVPNFTIENGELKADSPNRIKKEENEFVFVFDPTNTQAPPSDSDGLYLLKDRFVTISNGQQQAYTYSSIGSIPLTKTEVLDFFTFLKTIYPIAIFVLGFILLFINAFTSFIGISILAFIGMILSKQMQRILSYKQIWTLLAYCSTIPTIFFMIMKYLNISVLSPLLVYSLVTIVLLYITLKEVPPTKTKL